MRGKAFEDEERSKVPPHSNLYRCTKRTAGGASGSGSTSGISLSKQNLFLFRRDHGVIKVNSMLLVQQRQSGEKQINL